MTDDTLSQEIVIAFETQRQRVIYAEKAVETSLNHLRQLEYSVEMNMRHLKEARDGLHRMEKLLAKRHRLIAHNLNSTTPDVA